MSDIFVSYANEDASRVRLLVDAIEKQGWSVFWDRTIPTGKTWREVIGGALSDARCVVVVWSKYSVDSSWVHEEADEGRERGVLVPVMIDPLKPPIGFRSVQAADLVEWNGEEKAPALQKFVNELAEILGLPPKPADGSSDPSLGPLPYQRGHAEPWRQKTAEQSAFESREVGIAFWLPAFITTFAWMIGGAIGLVIAFVLAEPPSRAFGGAVGWGVAGIIGGLGVGYALRLVEERVRFTQVFVIAIGFSVGGCISGFLSWELGSALGGAIAGFLGGAVGGANAGHVLQLQTRYIAWTHVVLFSVFWAIGGGLGAGLSFAFFGYEYTNTFYAMTGAVVGFFVALVGGGLMLGTLTSLKRREQT